MTQFFVRKQKIMWMYHSCINGRVRERDRCPLPLQDRKVDQMDRWMVAVSTEGLWIQENREVVPLMSLGTSISMLQLNQSMVGTNWKLQVSYGSSHTMFKIWCSFVCLSEPKVWCSSLITKWYTFKSVWCLKKWCSSLFEE